MFYSREFIMRTPLPKTAAELSRLLPLLQGVPEGKARGFYGNVWMRWSSLGHPDRLYDEACALIKTIPMNEDWDTDYEMYRNSLLGGWNDPYGNEHGPLSRAEFMNHQDHQVAVQVDRLCNAQLTGTIAGRRALFAAADAATSLDSFLEDENVTPFREAVIHRFEDRAGSQFHLVGEKITA